MERFPRQSPSGLIPEPTLSIRMTSAPKSDRIMPTIGPGASPANSTTLIPDNGRPAGADEEGDDMACGEVDVKVNRSTLSSHAIS